MQKAKLNIFFAFCAIISSCATTRDKGIYKISVDSQPSSAKVSIYNKSGDLVLSTYTPDSIMLKSGAGYFKKENYLFIFSKDNYISSTDTLTFKVNKNYYENTFLSFLMPIGLLIVDPISGGMWYPKRKKINVTLLHQN